MKIFFILSLVIIGILLFSYLNSLDRFMQDLRKDEGEEDDEEE